MTNTAFIQYQGVRDATPVTIHLINSTGTPVQGGSPNTANTTPFSWHGDTFTFTAARREEWYSGGLPSLTGNVYQNVTGFNMVEETIVIGLIAVDGIQALNRKQELIRALNTARVTRPAILGYRARGHTAISYFEIYGADVQEIAPRGEWQNITNGFINVAFEVRMRRSAFSGLLNADQGIFTNQTSTTGGTAPTAPTNIISLASVAPTGDLAWEYQPMNIQFQPTTTGFQVGQVWMATMNRSGPIAQTFGATGTALTTTPQFVSSFNIILIPPQQQTGLKLRVVARIGPCTLGARFRIQICGNIAAAPVLFDSGFQAPTNTSMGLVDFGEFILSQLGDLSSFWAGQALRIMMWASDVSVVPRLVTLEIVPYYQFCKILNIQQLSAANASILHINAYRLFPERVTLPVMPSAVVMTPGTPPLLTFFPQLIGVAPQWVPSAGLWMHQLDTTGALPTSATTVTAQVSASYAPLWFTLQGSQ